MIFQNNGIEITYKEVKFLQKTVKIDDLRDISKVNLSLILREQLSLQDDVHIRALPQMVMVHDEFKDRFPL